MKKKKEISKSVPLVAYQNINMRDILVSLALSCLFYIFCWLDFLESRRSQHFFHGDAMKADILPDTRDKLKRACVNINTHLYELSHEGTHTLPTCTLKHGYAFVSVLKTKV